MQVLINGNTIPGDFVTAVLVGSETLHVHPAGELFIPDAVTIDRAPDGASPTVTDGILSGFSKPGEYRFKVQFLSGRWRWIDVFCFEPSVLDLVPAMQSSGSSTLRSEHERRMVLRSLAQSRTERADGTKLGITANDRLNLAVHGA